MERRLAAILAADVVGYSRLMGQDEAGTLERLKACEADVIEPAVSRHSGRIFKRMGDGYLIEFASVVAAVECALAWQESARDPILFRIGVHLGDVMVEDGDLFGDGVNVAARLEALAEPGGLCLSEDAQRQVRGKLEAALEDLGEQQLKNISEPMRVFRFAGRFLPPDDTPAADPAAAWQMPKVLLAPFRQLSASSDAEALAAGVTETLAAALSHFDEFELIDPGITADVITAKGAREAGRQLGATYVLEGSLQIAVGKARIGVQLIDASSGQRVWSETLDRSLDDVFALQDDITAIVASTVGEAVGEEQARAVANKATADLNAHELNVRGLQLLHRMNPEDNQLARGFFEQVLALVPNQPFPAICLGWTYSIELQNGWPSPRDDALDYCLGLLRDILRRDDRSAGAHRLMSRLLLLAGDHDQGLAHAERAYQLNPYSSDIIFSYGTGLMWNGRANEGLDKIERALAINPYAPPYYKPYLSIAYFFVGRHEDGLGTLKSVEGTVGPSRLSRIANLAALGRLEEARAEAQIVRQENPEFDLERLLTAYPFKRPEDRALLGDALRQAGLGK